MRYGFTLFRGIEVFAFVFMVKAYHFRSDIQKLNYARVVKIATLQQVACWELFMLPYPQIVKGWYSLQQVRLYRSSGSVFSSQNLFRVRV